MFIIYDSFEKGKGVLTTKKIKKGKFIGWYEGKLIRPKYITKKYDNKKYAIYDFQSDYGIISVKSPYHFTHFINDALNSKGIIQTIQSFNVKFELRKRYDFKYFGVYWPCFIAIRDIEVGEPIETFYGPDYWLNSDTNPYNENLISLFSRYTIENF